MSAALEGLEMIGDGTKLDADAVLARQPEVVCIDDLSVTDPVGESRFAAARRLAGITVIATVHLADLRDREGAPAPAATARSATAARAPRRRPRGHRGDGREGTAGDGRSAGPGDRDAAADAGRPGSQRGGDGAAGGGLDEAAVVALADEIELVDAPPSVLADRVRRGEIVPVAEIGQALQADYAAGKLGTLREQAFTVVAEHADHRLAGSAAASPPVPGSRLASWPAPRRGPAWSR